MATATSTRRTIHYAGRVQGVGFRYTVRNIALQFNVLGYVRNLPDGKVELVVEGPDSEIDQILQCIRERMSGFIKSESNQSSPATGEYPHFTIRH